MTAIERDLDRVLMLLRHTIRESGYTHLEVQKCLGWNRSHISELLRREKTLSLSHLLQILDVVSADRADFFTKFLQVPVPSFSGADFGPN